MEKLILIGIILLFVAIAFIIIGSLTTSKSNVKVAAGGFIGPIPFGFATSKGMFYILLIFLAIIFILTIIFRYLR